MTTRFKKVLSIAVALVMLLTLCLSAPLTVSAATVSVTVNNSGTVYTVDATVGQELPAPDTRVNAMTFLGWYSDPACTEEYGAVKENETRKAYAKYPSTFIGFEGKDNYVAGTDYRDEKTDAGVVTDPTNENNKVFKLHAKDMYANVTMPQYDDNDSGRYMLVSNHSYTFTFKFMIPGGSSVDSLVIRMNKGDLPTGGNGRTPFGEKHYKQSELTPNTWYTYTTTYDVGDTSLQTSPQLVALWNAGTNYDTDYVYFDDVIITDNSAINDTPIDNTYTSFEGCTVSYDGGFNSTTSASIVTEKAHSGSSSLKIAPGGANTYRAYAYNAPNSVLKLDSYTKYTISYWYMATSLAGSYTNIFTTLNGRGSVWDSNTQLNKTSIHSSALNEWHKAEFTVNTGDCSSQAYITLGLQTAAAGSVVYIDDVSVTAVEYIGMNDYYCDFSADFSHYGDPTSSSGSWPYYSSKVNFNTDNGILYFPTTHNTAPTSGGGTYVQHFAPYNGNNYYQFESNSSYRVVIRYKQTLANEGNIGYFSVGAKTNMPGSEGIKSLTINNQTGSTEWKEYTLDFTTGDLGSQKYLTLTFGSKDSSLAEFEVDYIKVTKGPFINNNGEMSKNTTAAGSEIPTPVYDENALDFIGWYSDPECTVPFGAVRENETRTAYARYNKTVITFGEGGLFDSRNDAVSVIVDPLNATNKVAYQDLGDYWTTIELSIYDAVNMPYYELIPNVDYTVTFDYRLTSALNSPLQIRVNSGTIADYNANYPKTVYTNTELTVPADKTDDKWHTYTATFNSGNLANGNHLFLCLNTTDFADKGVYIDNVTLYNSAQFEEVTLNNRGVISTVETVVGINLPALNSDLDEQVFLGWYSDPECTVEFGAVQANESRTAYAKYDTVKVTFGDGKKQLNSGDTFNVPCYDGVSNALNLKANKTYAMRFIYKTLEGSDAGKFTVLGNSLTFDAYSADKANVWAPGSITFTTTEATALQLALTSSGNASVYIDDLLIYEIDYTPEATVTAGNSTIDVSKPVAQNNMQTGKVNINLANGEQLKVGGLTVTYDLYATAFSEPVSSKIMFSTGSYDLDKDNEPGNGNEFFYMVPANAKNIKISAEFVSADESNFAVIAGSIRQKSDIYTSGLRFRARVYNNANISKVGFILAPEKFVTAAGYKTLTLENAAACSAVTADVTNVIYDKSDLYTDHQVILTKVDKIIDLGIQCVVYIEYADGTVEYSEPKTQSYNSIEAVMDTVHYGITSYHTDEYEDTRNKLLQSQNNGTFSFLSLTDIHIDYIKDVQEGEYWYTTPVGGKLPDRYNVQREIAMVIEMANTTDVDCIILGGDLIHGTSSHASSLADLNYLAQVFQKAKVPVIAARGNHDNNDYHGKPCALQHIITNEEWTTTLIDPLAKNAEAVHDDANDAYSPYYYVDFPEKKTRVVVLDAWNYPLISNDGIHSVYAAENGWSMYGDNAQVEWLAKVALDAELQGWNYVLSSHAPTVGDESGTSTNANLIRSIITAFNNKTTVNVFGTTMDYSNYDGQIPLNISGHTHIQSWRLLGDDHVAVNTASGRFAYYPSEVLFDYANGKEYQPVRWEGTYSEACFDAVVYDPAIDTIQRFNFGNRPDDKFVITENGIEVTEIPHEGELAQ